MSSSNSTFPSLQRMIRLDANRYVGNGLVSHAEYQLFLDEMRQQSKFFQPDHWNEYTFPAGQEECPVVGVCPSDVVAFCEWLTQREGGEWGYRLPNLREVDYVPPQEPIPAGTYAGYWSAGFWMKEDLNHGFVRVGPPAPRLTIDRLIERHMESLNLAEVLSQNTPLDTALRLELNRNRAFAFTDVLSHPIISIVAGFWGRDVFALPLNRDLDVARADSLKLDLATVRLGASDPRSPDSATLGY